MSSTTEQVVQSEIIQIVGRTGIAGEVIQVRVKVPSFLASIVPDPLATGLSQKLHGLAKRLI